MIVFVLEIGYRECIQINNKIEKTKESEEIKDISEENSPKLQSNQEFDLFSSIFSYTYQCYSIDLILYFRDNCYNKTIISKIWREKYDSASLDYKIVEEIGDLWFALSDNIKRFDSIYIFSNEIK